MRRTTSLLAAALIVGLLVFILFRWGMKYSQEDSLIIALTSAISGIVVEYLRPFIGRRRRF